MRPALLLVALAACHPEMADQMERQPRPVPYATSELFADGRAMRPPPAGAIPRERDLDDQPPALTPQLLALGHTRFDVVCAPCHGALGDGDSLIAGKMELRAPPSLHTQHARDLTASGIHDILRDGYGLMPRYATHLDAHERWAVVGYVRALQLSQHLPIDDAPADLRRRIEEAP